MRLHDVHESLSYTRFKTNIGSRSYAVAFTLGKSLPDNVGSENVTMALVAETYSVLHRHLSTKLHF